MVMPRDITKILDAEQSETKVDWKAHLEALPLATWIGEPNGGKIFVNRAYRQMLGVTNMDDVVDRGWEQHLYPADKAHYVKAWADFVEGRKDRFIETVRWIRPDTGSTIKIAVRAQKLECGQFQGWIRQAHLELALSKLEELAYVRP